MLGLTQVRSRGVVVQNVIFVGVDPSHPHPVDVVLVSFVMPAAGAVFETAETFQREYHERLLGFPWLANGTGISNTSNQQVFSQD